VTLAIQLVALAGAIVVVAALLRGDASRRTIAASTAAVATVVVGALGLQPLWPTARKHVEVAKGQRALPPLEVAAGGGRAIGVNADFVEWARNQVTGGDRFYLVPSDDTVMQWLSYRMLPRLAAERPQRGTVLVFYDTTPEKAGYAKSALSDVRMYQPKFSTARLETPKGS
jgi:hypothetical protein